MKGTLSISRNYPALHLRLGPSRILSFKFKKKLFIFQRSIDGVYVFDNRFYQNLKYEESDEG